MLSTYYIKGRTSGSQAEYQVKKYDAIVIGACHNGLTNAAYLAKAGLDVAVLERNAYIGGATVSRELYKDWTYSNCSYVCSLLRPEIARDLELPRHGLQTRTFWRIFSSGISDWYWLQELQKSLPQALQWWRRS